MGEDEVQVFDSFGKKPEAMGSGDMGAIYSAAKPTKNPIKKPGEWNKYVIDFRAPKFDDKGKRTSPAKFVKVTLNDEALHENVEMKGPTPGGRHGQGSGRRVRSCSRAIMGRWRIAISRSRR